jgi:Tfp pilus assembly protein PilV
MQLTHSFMMLFGVSLVGLAAFCCFTLLKTAQSREDAEDDRLWHYLLDPRTP